MGGPYRIVAETRTAQLPDAARHSRGTYCPSLVQDRKLRDCPMAPQATERRETTSMLHSGPAFSVDGAGRWHRRSQVRSRRRIGQQDQCARPARISPRRRRQSRNDTSVKGIVLTSGKGVFIVGADITEFGRWFADGPDAIVAAPGQRPPDPGALRRPAHADASRRSMGFALAVARSWPWRATSGSCPRPRLSACRK